jgi:hypothetical protein
VFMLKKKIKEIVCVFHTNNLANLDLKQANILMDEDVNDVVHSLC